MERLLCAATDARGDRAVRCSFDDRDVKPRPRVLIVGAGLAGLTAALELEKRNIHVIVVEARNRIGGRVWTLRDGFGGMHGEAGGDLIDGDQEELLRLIAALGLRADRVLRRGFWHYRGGSDGRRRKRSFSTGWRLTARALAPLTRAYRLNEKQWTGPIAAAIAKVSVMEWLDKINGPGSAAGAVNLSESAVADVRATAVGMRGFFLADPSELSLLAYLDQFVSGNPARQRMYRIRGGNDRLPQRLARSLHAPVRLHQVVRRIVQGKSSVRVTLESARKRQIEITCDYAIIAVPAPLAVAIEITPPLPDAQREALARLRYGRATKVLLQLNHHPWRRGARPRAYATDLDIGAVWDASEEQPGRRAIITLLAGGSASDATQEFVATHGAKQLAGELQFFGLGRARVLAARSITWEDDPWARGAYAFFDWSFRPGRRSLLGLPWKRIFFAGEHTSIAWQGYMNGAVESGMRVAEEVSTYSGSATKY